MPHLEHTLSAKAHIRSVRVAIVTVSDTRTFETDEGGKLVRTLLESSGHSVEYYDIVKDSRSAIRHTIEEILKKHAGHAIILTGGSGIAKRDVTPEAASSFFKRELPGFGEIFRELSYNEIGSAAMLSRACAGQTKNGTIIFVLPGSTSAVQLAMERLILPQLSHLVWEWQK